MPAHFDETWDEETGREFPRFLSTQPAEATQSRLSLGAAGSRPVRYVTIALAASTALFASAYLAPENTLKHASVSANIEVMPVRIVRQDTAMEPALQDRLSFARPLQSHLFASKSPSASAAAEVTGSLEQVAETVDLPGAKPAEPDTVTLLLVRNLPEGMTFSDGVAAGLGVWAIGGQVPKELLALVGNAPPQPVTADVDLIAASGATISSQKIDIPAAETTPLAPVAAVSPLAVQEIAANAESFPKPAKRHHRPRARAAADVAASDEVDEEGSKPKLKRKKRQFDDAYRNPRSAAPQVKTAQRENETGADEPQGPIAKFFAWLKGGAKAASQNEAGTETAASSQYQRGTRHGLGMAPDEK